VWKDGLELLLYGGLEGKWIELGMGARRVLFIGFWDVRMVERPFGKEFVEHGIF